MRQSKLKVRANKIFLLVENVTVGRSLNRSTVYLQFKYIDVSTQT